MEVRALVTISHGLSLDLMALSLHLPNLIKQCCNVIFIFMYLVIWVEPKL